MADHSAIEWTEATWNPTSGCTKVRPVCDRCSPRPLRSRVSPILNAACFTVAHRRGQHERLAGGRTRNHLDVRRRPLFRRSPESSGVPHTFSAARRDTNGFNFKRGVRAALGGDRRQRHDAIAGCHDAHASAHIVRTRPRVSCKLLKQSVSSGATVTTVESPAVIRLMRYQMNILRRPSDVAVVADVIARLKRRCSRGRPRLSKPASAVVSQNCR